MNGHAKKLFGLVLLLVLSACVSTPPPQRHEQLATEFNKRAFALEQQGELFQALSHYRAARFLGDDSASQDLIINDLQQRISRQAETQFQRGRSLFQQGKSKQARTALIKALSINPQHDQAIQFLRERMVGLFTEYTVAEGDTAEQIALLVYGDVAKTRVIQYLYEGEQGLQPGTILHLPIIDLQPDAHSSSVTPKSVPQNKDTAPVPQLDASQGMADTFGENEAAEVNQMPNRVAIDLMQAAELLQEGQYQPALQRINQVLDADSQQHEAMQLRNRAYMGMSAEHVQAQRYQQALQTLEQVDKGFPGRQELYRQNADGLQRQQQELENERLYQLGLELISQEDYQAGVDVLQQLDPEYRDVEAVIGSAQKSSKILADRYYKQGVNFFVKEQIKEAIHSWQKTLQYDPANTDAQRNLQRAEQLLDRLRNY